SALSTRTLPDLPQRFMETGYILLDQMSMIGQDLLDLMSIRARQVLRRQVNDDTKDRHLGRFGGLNLIPAGDSIQLPPVGAAPMWSDRTGTRGHREGDGMRGWG
ncbi:unnamed protein product, partial [Hapterophycus canaliculatus]